MMSKTNGDDGGNVFLKDVSLTCANCGAPMTPSRQVGPYANVPVSCGDVLEGVKGCESTGSVSRDRVGRVTGGYGAVEIEVGD